MIENLMIGVKNLTNYLSINKMTQEDKELLKQSANKDFEDMSKEEQAIWCSYCGCEGGCNLCEKNKMIKQDKELLIKDLCSRLPYGVKCHIGVGEHNIYELIRIEVDRDNPLFDFGDDTDGFPIQAYASEIKPYLFPLSSITEEQKKEYYDICWTDWIDNKSKDISAIEVLYKTTDWLNAHHFDYRGLIDKGLAIDATDLNIY